MKDIPVKCKCKGILFDISNRMQNHLEVKVVKCDKCGKSFAYKIGNKK